MHKNFLKIQNGLICTVHVPQYARVFCLEGSISDRPTKESIHVGNNVHIVDNFGQYMQHSFSPNCTIQGLMSLLYKTYDRRHSDI